MPVSTYIYLQCLDHTPPLRAADESGQHLYDLPQLRADIANRDRIAAAAADGWVTPEYFRAATARFLVEHPTCRLGIIDEYDQTHPLLEGDHHD
jgi:hypothetical protein